MVDVEVEGGNGNPCNEIIFDKRSGSRICLDTGEVIEEGVIGEGIDNISRAGDDVYNQPIPLQHSRHDLGVGASLSAARGRGPISQNRIRAKLKKGHVQGVPNTRQENILIGLLIKLNDASVFLEFPDSARDTAAAILRCFSSKLEKTPTEAEKNAIVAYALVKAAQLHSLPVERGRIFNYMKLSDSDSRYWSVMSNEKMRECVLHYNKKIALRRRKDPLREISPFVTRLVRQLKLDSEVGRLAMEFLSKNLEAGKTFHGKKPESLAAAAVYLVAKVYGYDHVNQSTVAKALGLRESNVRKTYRQLISGIRIIVTV